MSLAAGPAPTPVLATPDPARPGRARRLASPLLAGGLTLAGTLALHARDPHAAGSWGHCPTALLGFACPLCGGLRAVNDLTHLDLGAATSSNLLLVLALPVVVALWLRRVAVLWRGGAVAAPLDPPRWLWITLGIVVTAFTVARNLPVGGWLAP